MKNSQFDMAYLDRDSALYNRTKEDVTNVVDNIFPLKDKTISHVLVTTWSQISPKILPIAFYLILFNLTQIPSL